MKLQMRLPFSGRHAKKPKHRKGSVVPLRSTTRQPTRARFAGQSGRFTSGQMKGLWWGRG